MASCRFFGLYVTYSRKVPLVNVVAVWDYLLVCLLGVTCSKTVPFSVSGTLRRFVGLVVKFG